MASHSIIHIDEVGVGVVAFPAGKSLADWTTYKRIFTVDASPDTDTYRVTVDDANGSDWLIFVTTAAGVSSYVPASKNDYAHVWSVPETGSSSSTSGDYAITVSVTSSSVAVQGAKVTILQSGVIVGYDYTPANGRCVFLLNAGSYTINVSAHGFTAIVGQSLTVTTTATASVALTAVAISTPPSSGLCTVRFVVFKNDGTTPIEDAVIKANLDMNTATDGIILSNVRNSTTTDSDGIGDLVLVQQDSIIKGSKYYTIEVYDPADLDASDPVMRIRAKVPNQSTAYAEDLIPE